jgi:4'-phosphopantetheinyl transferase EntD
MTQDWEAHFRKALGLPLVLAFVTDQDPPPELTPREQALCDALQSDLRRETWLSGRGALKRVLSRLGENPDTASLAFPHPRCSLSHSGRAAVAVGLETGARAQGIGIDLELDRTPPEQSARFFLGPAELGWLDGVPAHERDHALLRLWTVKEAVFKADPSNAESRLLTRYRLEDPSQPAGQALSGENRFLYASLAIPNGALSVAVLV